MAKFLKGYDTFAIPVEFNINGNLGAATKCGGFISILIKILVILSGIGMYSAIFMEKTPIVTLSVENQDDNNITEYKTSNVELSYALMSTGVLASKSSPSFVDIQSPSNSTYDKIQSINITLNDNNTSNINSLSIGSVLPCVTKFTGMEKSLIQELNKKDPIVARTKMMEEIGKLGNKSQNIQNLVKLFPISDVVNAQCMQFDKETFSLGSNKLKTGFEVGIQSISVFSLCQISNNPIKCNKNNYESMLEQNNFNLVIMYSDTMINYETGDILNPIIELTYLQEKSKISKEMFIDISKDIVVGVSLVTNILNVNRNVYLSFLPSNLITNTAIFTTIELNIKQVPRKSSLVDSFGVPLMTMSLVFERKSTYHNYNVEYKKADEVLATMFAIRDLIYMTFEILLGLKYYKLFENELIKNVYHATENDDVANEDTKKVEVELRYIEIGENSDVGNVKKAVRKEITSNAKDLNNTENIAEIDSRNIEGSSLSKDILTPNDTRFKLVEETIKKKKVFLSQKVKYLCCGIGDICVRNCLYSDKELKTFIIGELLLEYDLNIVNLIKRLIEVEKMKKILLNDYQQKCFKIIKGRIIDPNSDVDEYPNSLDDELNLKTKDPSQQYIDNLNCNIENLYINDVNDCTRDLNRRILEDILKSFNC